MSDNQEELITLDIDHYLAVIEAMIFMSDRPLSIQNIKKHLGDEISLRNLHEMIEKLQFRYEKKNHGIRLIEVASGYQFRTKQIYSSYLKSLFKRPTFTLSPTALEVLAIVAYKGPVSRTEIDRVRGVDSSHVMRGLIDKKLVKVEGKSNDMGNPLNYIVTNEFLDYFNLNSLNDLPTDAELEFELSQEGVGEISDIRNLVQEKESLVVEKEDLEQIDDLGQKIKNINAQTDFTSLLYAEEVKKKKDESSNIKSSFELLEEEILKKQIKEQNQLASVSLSQKEDFLNFLSNFNEIDESSSLPSH